VSCVFPRKTERRVVGADLAALKPDVITP